MTIGALRRKSGGIKVTHRKEKEQRYFCPLFHFLSTKRTKGGSNQRSSFLSSVPQFHHFSALWLSCWTLVFIDQGQHYVPNRMSFLFFFFVFLFSAFHRAFIEIKEQKSRFYQPSFLNLINSAESGPYICTKLFPIRKCREAVIWVCQPEASGGRGGSALYLHTLVSAWMVTPLPIKLLLPECSTHFPIWRLTWLAFWDWTWGCHLLHDKVMWPRACPGLVIKLRHKKHLVSGKVIIPARGMITAAHNSYWL